MRNLLSRLAAALLVLFGLALSGCGSQSAREAEPALWSISDENGRQGYLFGTVHSLPPDLDWVDPRVQAALDASGVLVLEIANLDDPAAIEHDFAALGRSPGQAGLAERVSAPNRALAGELAAKAGLNAQAIASLESWALALTLATAATSETDAVRDAGAEAVLKAWFDAADRPTIGLETAREQFGYFDRLAEDDQRAMLDAVIVDASAVKADYAAIVAAWANGDVEAIAALGDGAMLERPAIREALLVARNRAWVGAIAETVADGGKPFIAVGAAHLAGPDSVQAMLAARGFTVTRIH